MTRTSKMALGIAAFLLVGVVLLYLVEWAALDVRYHLQLHDALRSDVATGLTTDGVDRAAHRLVDYLYGKDAPLAYVDQVYGEAKQVFGDDEIAHMVDVLALFDAGRRIRLVMLVAGLALAFLGGFKAAWRTHALRMMARAVISWLALIAGVAAFVALDFNRAFILFHRLLFQNDLWLMDESQLMIRMMPESFFVAVAGHIALFVGIGLIALIVIGAILSRRRKST